MVVDGLLPKKSAINARDKVVLVIGGGDTGSDCVGTANRQGAKNVHQFEILDQPPEWKSSWNPKWPHWPNILRTSSSQEEGCQRQWGILTKSFEISKGILTSARFSKVGWDIGNDGKRPEMREIEGSEFSIKVDLVLLAMGFVHVEQGQLLKELGVEYDSYGNIKTTPDYKTSRDGVFAAGDANKGASLIVHAIHQGRQAAKSIDDYLKIEGK